MADEKKAPVTDDQELAKVLASMNDQAANAQPGATPAPAPSAPGANNSGLEEDIPPIPATLPAAPAAAPAPAPTPVIENHGTTPGIMPSPAAVPAPSAPVISAAPGSLDDIKRQALDELRPIVSKLDLPAEEKFDALLLVIRSSDDQSLVQAAYQAAEGIADEAKKAQALLDIVKEIEYFSSQGK